MAEKDVTTETSAVWGNHVTVPDTPAGFTVRTTYPTNPNGVEVMLERWKAGTEEPPHSHPGDDMTVVVEGKMSIQFFTTGAAGLVPDGDRIVLHKGEPATSAPEGFTTPNTLKIASWFTFTTELLDFSCRSEALTISRRGKSPGPLACTS